MFCHYPVRFWLTRHALKWTGSLQICVWNHSGSGASVMLSTFNTQLHNSIRLNQRLRRLRRCIFIQDYLFEGITRLPLLRYLYLPNTSVLFRSCDLNILRSYRVHAYNPHLSVMLITQKKWTSICYIFCIPGTDQSKMSRYPMWNIHYRFVSSLKGLKGSWMYSRSTDWDL